jgi:benzoyl-CoA reductase subunit B
MPEDKVKTSTWIGEKGKKHLQIINEATALDKEYRNKMWEGLAKGEQFIFGYGPLELFNSMGLYYVIPPAYGSIIAAKQMYSYYQGVLEKRGYSPSLSRYDSLVLGYAFDKKPEKAPYGGLPKPSAVIESNTETPGLFELYAREFGCPLYFMDTVKNTKIPPRWWESEDWGDPDIVEQWVTEMEGCADFLESVTGKPYSETKLREYLERANETCDYYQKMADLAYTTIPSPISASDIYSEVSVFETHLGEEWALEHARKLYQEVKERVEKGQSVCPDERVRLIWSWPPLWFSLGFYNHWEESHGAVFLNWDYMARAGTHIIHDLRRPLKAQALRRNLRYRNQGPIAESEYAVYQAKKYKVDGVIIPISPSGTRDLFIPEALEKEGIPVLKVVCEPFNSQDWDDDKMKALVTKFIESLKR